MPRYRTAYPPEFQRQMVDLVRCRPEERPFLSCGGINAGGAKSTAPTP